MKRIIKMNAKQIANASANAVLLSMKKKSFYMLIFVWLCLGCTDSDGLEFDKTEFKLDSRQQEIAAKKLTVIFKDNQSRKERNITVRANCANRFGEINITQKIQ